MEGFPGPVTAALPITCAFSLGQATTSQGRHCLPLYRQGARSPERPHNVPPPSAEALRKQGQPRQGELQACPPSSLSAGAHRAPCSLKRRDRGGARMVDGPGRSPECKCPASRGCGYHRRQGAGSTLVSPSDTGLPGSAALWVQSLASHQSPCTHQIPQSWVHTSFPCTCPGGCSPLKGGPTLPLSREEGRTMVTDIDKVRVGRNLELIKDIPDVNCPFLPQKGSESLSLRPRGKVLCN